MEGLKMMKTQNASKIGDLFRGRKELFSFREWYFLCDISLVVPSSKLT